MGLLTDLRDSISRVVDRLFSENKPKRIGIYGPPNVGKATLADRVARGWTGGIVGPESHILHEARHTRRKENVEIERNGKEVTADIIDTPGVTTKIDYKEFLEHDMEKDDAVYRSREAIEGATKAMHWSREDVDNVIYVLDGTKNPISQVNTTLISVIENQDLSMLIFTNEIGLEDPNAKRIANAYPQHETVELSAFEGENMDEVYARTAKYFA